MKYDFVNNGTEYNDITGQEICEIVGLTSPPDGIAETLIPDIILGSILCLLFIFLCFIECRSCKMAKDSNTFYHASGDAKQFYHWGWAVIVLAFITAFGNIFVFGIMGGNCSNPFTHFLGQTTGQTFFATKYCLYVAQVYRLKSIVNKDRKDKQLQTALEYPKLLYIVILFIIIAESLFLMIYWYIFIFYCGDCTPFGLFVAGTWFLPYIIGNDAFWFLFLTTLFIIKIVLISKTGTHETELNAFKRILWAILFVGIISNISGIIFMSLANKWLIYAGEFAMTDAFINTICIMLMFEHNRSSLIVCYLKVVGTLCCMNTDRLLLAKEELEYDFNEAIDLDAEGGGMKHNDPGNTANKDAGEINPGTSINPNETDAMNN